jgi:hypothetical protein
LGGPRPAAGGADSDFNRVLSAHEVINSGPINFRCSKWLGVLSNADLEGGCHCHRVTAAEEPEPRSLLCQSHKTYTVASTSTRLITVTVVLRLPQSR